MIYDPTVETRPVEKQFELDRDSYRQQVEYLFENSPFYQRKLRAAGFDDAAAVGGLDDIAQLPFTEKDELRKMLSDLKLELDLDTVMSSFGERSHREGSINLQEWEKGLDDSIKAAIEAKLDEEAGKK